MENKEHTQQIIDAFDDLPIMARIEFVSNLICNKAGEESEPTRDEALVAAHGVLTEVIRILKTVPDIGELRGPL